MPAGGSQIAYNNICRLEYGSFCVELQYLIPLVCSMRMQTWLKRINLSHVTRVQALKFAFVELRQLVLIMWIFRNCLCKFAMMSISNT